MIAKFNLENALKSISARITPDQRAEDELRNRDAISRIDPNSPKARAARASAQETAILEQIVFLETEPDGELKAARMNVALDRLGELRAEQGDYKQAIKVTADTKRREQYQAIQKAIDRPDDEVCDCPDNRVVDRGADATLAVRTKIATVMSEKHGRFVSLEKCHSCAKLQAH